MPLVDEPRAAVCGDFDADGLLDVIVAGRDGLALLSRESADRWSNVTYLTGELAYHGNANRPQITACALCDVNTDGRQGMAMFYADRKPLLFFNRGFACFGWARELNLDPAAAAAGLGLPDDPTPQPKPETTAGPEDLKQGQTTGVIVDLNGDGVPDMLAVGVKEREVWAVFGRRQQGPPRRTCTLALPPTAPGPVTVTVREGRRIASMYVVRPGIPVSVGCAQAGPLALAWVGPDGKAVSREVLLVGESNHFELKPASDNPAGPAVRYPRE
ncbi:MAG: VCBS repeat-containing protein [Planctomycetota bacterium]|nr:VCBS repeat-containing protein [Planctomycetota bacterium]